MSPVLTRSSSTTTLAKWKARSTPSRPEQCVNAAFLIVKSCMHPALIVNCCVACERCAHDEAEDEEANADDAGNAIEAHDDAGNAIEARAVQALRKQHVSS